MAIDGNRLRFAHPLLAHGVYSAASPARRRDMHARLAGIVDQPELQARHLALAATSADPHTLQSLDGAAEMASIRGAPAAAAELVDLAVALGGDTHERQIQSATYHFDAGDHERARQQLESTIDTLTSGALRAQALNLLALLHAGTAGFPEAVSYFERALVEVDDDRALRVQVLTGLSWALMQSNKGDTAMERIEEALPHAELLSERPLLGRVLALRVQLQFLSGDGLDADNLKRAVELADGDGYRAKFVHPWVQKAFLLAWTGELDAAHDEFATLRRRWADEVGEVESIHLGYHSMLVELWRGNVAAAELEAEDITQRALLYDGAMPRYLALMVVSIVAAYAGRVDEARQAIAQALKIDVGSVASLGMLAGLRSAGFLEVSAANYAAALDTMAPLLTAVNATPKATEIISAGFLPDAIEALIQLGRLDEAEPLIAMLERNGRRLDRAWMLAVGGRGRAMLLAARGDLDGANAAVHEAMTEHQRLPMPFERARTQLLQGQLLRRQRHKEAAQVALNESLETFETLGTPLWADRVRAALARSNVGPRPTSGLSPSEHRVAELAASGMTNREVAAELFISPKTVEANLARVYHKLGIRSRAELGQRMGPENT